MAAGPADRMLVEEDEGYLEQVDDHDDESASAKCGLKKGDEEA